MKEELTNAQKEGGACLRLVELLGRIEARYYASALSLN
jgi:hypothetical protein